MRGAPLKENPMSTVSVQSKMIRLTRTLLGFLVCNVVLFVFCTAFIGWTATVKAFGILHVGCTLGTLVLWWWESRTPLPDEAGANKRRLLGADADHVGVFQ